jgi:uncharacterized phiE125 gp8 family phage protein
MGLSVFTPPAEEPITIAEARLHLRVTHNEEDVLILALIAAAREHAEAHTRRRFITQEWDWVMDAFPSTTVELPGAPLQSITSVSYLDGAGGTQVLAVGAYQVDIKTDPGRIAPANGTTWPTTPTETLNAVTIRFVCGYGKIAAVPKTIKQAMLLMIGHWWEHREEVSDFELFPVPYAVDALLSPFRVLRF